MSELLKKAIREAVGMETPTAIDAREDIKQTSVKSISKKELSSQEKKYINTHIDKGLLPSPIKEYFIDVSERLELPFEMVATAGFAFLCNLISDKLCLVPTKNIKNRVIPNIWGCIISEKGTRKTPLFEAFFTDIIYKNNFANIERFEEEKERYENVLKALSSKRKALIKAEADGDSEKIEELQAAIERLETKAKEKPKSKYLIVSDATKEKLTDIASTNIQGFLIFQDELSHMLYGFEKDPQMRSMLLTAWSGAKPYTITRIQRGDVNIKKLTIGLFGGIQPELYRKLVLQDSDNITSGFNDRFQLIYINKSVKYKISDQESNDFINQKFEELVTLLVDRKLENCTKAKEYPYADGLFHLRLTEEAKTAWINFLEGLSNDSTLAEQYPDLRGFFSKIDKLLGSIAILIYTTEALQKPKYDHFIPLEVMQRAIEITKFYVYQAIDAFNIASMLDYQREIDFEKKRDKILDYVSSQKLPIKLRDVYHAKNVGKNLALQVLEPYYVIEKHGKSYIITSQKTSLPLKNDNDNSL